MADELPGGFLTLSDLEEAARTKVPERVWTYIQGGAGEESTLRANRKAFDRWTLRPRVLVDVTTLDLSTTLLGERVGAPFFVAPTAYQGQVHADGELGTARAASAANVLAMFSTLSSRSLEEIAEKAPRGPRWFQLYLQPEFRATSELVERAERAGYSALVLTVDVPVLGLRDQQAHGGFALESSIPVGNGKDIVTPPRSPEPKESRFSLPGAASATWEVLDQLSAITRLPLVVKGILTPEDARRAVDHRARGIVVSNHGGRQLDRAPTALEVLGEVRAEVGSDAELYVDGGVRRGSDILVALALGARAVGLGRPVLWALAAGGEGGVTRLLSLLKADLATAMALTGCRTVPEVDSSLVRPSV